MSHILLLYIQGEVHHSLEPITLSSLSSETNQSSGDIFISYHGYQVLYYDDQYHGTHTDHGSWDHHLHFGEDHLQLKQSTDEKELPSSSLCSSDRPTTADDDHESYKCLMLGIPIEMPQEVINFILSIFHLVLFL